MKTIKMTYSEFCYVKQCGYSLFSLKKIACRYLDCKIEDIDDIVFNYGLTFDVYFKTEVSE